MTQAHGARQFVGQWESILTPLSRWLFLASLVFAPWFYGSTRTWTEVAITWVMGGVIALWACSLLLRRQWPRVPWILIIPSLWLMIQGGWMAWNAKSIYDTDYHRFLPLTPLFPDWAGSVDKPVSVRLAFRCSCLLVYLWIACDISRRDLWRRRIWWTLALTGASIAILGLLQRLTHAPGIFWVDEKFAPTFFATYRYHGNAGAFLNLTWPLLAGLTFMVFEQGRGQLLKNFCALSLAALVAAIFVNTSRASAFLGLLGGVGIFGWLVWRWFRREQEEHLKSRLVVMLSVVMCVGAIAYAAGTQMSLNRWRHFADDLDGNNGRLIAAKVSWRILPQAGWLGYGPGTFQWVFPFFTKEDGKRIPGWWRDAHQDYLQTGIEWGKIGAAAWAWVIGTGIFLGLKRSHHDGEKKLPKRIRDEEILFRVTALTAIALVLLHSILDFPLQIASIQMYFFVILGMLCQKRIWIAHSTFND